MIAVHACVLKRDAVVDRHTQAGTRAAVHACREVKARMKKARAQRHKMATAAKSGGK